MQITSVPYTVSYIKPGGFDSQANRLSGKSLSVYADYFDTSHLFVYTFILGFQKGTGRDKELRFIAAFSLGEDIPYVSNYELGAQQLLTPRPGVATLDLGYNLEAVG